MANLGTFDGKPVRRTSVEIPNLGGGLRDAMRTDPRIVRMGDRLFMVSELSSDGKVRHDPVDDGDAYERVHILKARTATFVDEDLVRDHLDAQIERNVARRDAETGAMQIPGVNGEDNEKSKVREHAEGLHKRKRKDCPLCQAPEGDEPATVTELPR